MGVDMAFKLLINEALESSDPDVVAEAKSVLEIIENHGHGSSKFRLRDVLKSSYIEKVYPHWSPKVKVASNNVDDASAGGTLIEGNMHNGNNYNLGPHAQVIVQKFYMKSSSPIPHNAKQKKIPGTVGDTARTNPTLSRPAQHHASALRVKVPPTTSTLVSDVNDMSVESLSPHGPRKSATIGGGAPETPSKSGETPPITPASIDSTQSMTDKVTTTTKKSNSSEERVHARSNVVAEPSAVKKTVLFPNGCVPMESPPAVQPKGLIQAFALPDQPSDDSKITSPVATSTVSTVPATACIEVHVEDKAAATPSTDKANRDETKIGTSRFSSLAAVPAYAAGLIRNTSEEVRKSTTSVVSDDSSSDDSSLPSDESSIIDTILVTGASNVGKTKVIDALMLKLGKNVNFFEANASVFKYGCVKNDRRHFPKDRPVAVILVYDCTSRSTKILIPTMKRDINNMYEGDVPICIVANKMDNHNDRTPGGELATVAKTGDVDNIFKWLTTMSG